jgi:hypothetical protein
MGARDTTKKKPNLEFQRDVRRYYGPVRRRTCSAENLYGGGPVRRRTCTAENLYGGEPVRPIQWGPVRRRTCTTDPMGTCTAENLYDRSNGDLFGGDDVRRNYCPVRRHYDTMTLDSLGDSRIGGDQMISEWRHGENPKSKFPLTQPLVSPLYPHSVHARDR